MKRRFSAAAFSLWIAAVAVEAWAGETCTPEAPAEKLGQVEATADIMPNVLKRSGSLRYESERLLKEATELAQQSEPPQECLTACGGQPKAEVVFSSNPLEVKSAYDGSENCAEKARRTAAEPFIISDRNFSSIEEAAGWIESFSQGKGADGQRLYEECDGGCSPRYTFYLTPQQNNIILNASVRCGHARDREDNRYLLTAAYRWTCPG